MNSIACLIIARPTLNLLQSPRQLIQQLPTTYI